MTVRRQQGTARSSPGIVTVLATCVALALAAADGDALDGLAAARPHPLHAPGVGVKWEPYVDSEGRRSNGLHLVVVGLV